LKFSGNPRPQEPWETYDHWKATTSHGWGLLEWITDSMRSYGGHKCLIEAKGPGLPAVQMLQDRCSLQNWTVEGVNPGNRDKVARALAVQPMFAEGMVFAPATDWADMVQTEMSQFPKGKHDDLTDSVTQALNHFRDTAFGDFDRRIAHMAQEVVRHRRKLAPLYPV